MRRFVMFLVLSVALAGALVVAPSQTKPAKAVAYDSPYTVDVLPNANGYDISINLACIQQYGAGAFAQYWSASNPYSWGCYRVISWWPYQLRYLGGLDLNRYCQRNHPGTYAKLTEPWRGVWGWSCARLPA